MSNESTVWNIPPENSTKIPLEFVEQQGGYVLLLVILFILLVGTLIAVSITVVACHRYCHDGQFCYRASDDPEKATAYMEETQPTHEITIRVDESDCLSMASSHDQETERFLSTGPTGRRVSFNEAALFDHGKKAQEKGRRYTLTEGDFHHLKNARLTNLHIPPPALKIVTIHECDSAENTITMTTRPATKSALSIFQPMLCPLPQTSLTGLSVSPSSALPEDALNSMVDSSFSGSSVSPSNKEEGTRSVEKISAGLCARGSGSGVAEGTKVGNGSSPAASSGAGSPRPVLQFLTKLRRHASLEGASPYFKIKKWKLDSSQRASSLDTRGSPKRRQFQRQRAASESMDQEDNDAHHIDLIQYIAHTQDAGLCPNRARTSLISPPSTPSPSLGRVEVQVMVEPSCGQGGPGVIGLSPDLQEEALLDVGWECTSPSESLHQKDSQSLYRDIWTLRASLEQCATSDQSINNDQNSVCSDADSVCSLSACTETETGGLVSMASQDLGDEGERGEDYRDYRVHVREKTNEEESIKIDQVSSEQDHGESEVESGTRKLLQMDSGYTSIEAPYRGPEDLRLFGGSSISGSPKDRTAHEKRHNFTNSGRTSTIGDSFELDLFEEEPIDESLLDGGGKVSTEAAEAGAASLSWYPYGQMLTPREAAHPPPQPLTLHQRDYSIDEKTDALFHEFLRHDPQFDQQESPRKHRSRIHLRKQWQRHKQWSDPGVRHLHSSFERHRTPLRRGESVNCPLDTSYHSMLPRIVSAPDEESSEGADGAPETPRVELTSQADSEARTSSSRSAPPSSFIICKEGVSTWHSENPEDGKCSKSHLEPPDESSPPDMSGYGPQTITAELTDKLTSNLSERLYTSLLRTKDTATDCVTTTATHASPDHSPV